jgi:hypothetical protein
MRRLAASELRQNATTMNGRVSEEDIRLIAEGARKAAEEARLLAETTRAEARQACEDTARQLEELRTMVLRLSEASKKS